MTTNPANRTKRLVRERSGAGEPLLLLHGVGESAAGWRPIQDALSKSFDVIVVDLPGFGAAPPLPRGVAPTAAALADAIERQLDELGLRTVHIAGYSLGARVSLELASRGRARSVVAISPDGLGTPAERTYEALSLLGRRLLAHVLAPVAKEVTSTVAGRAAFFGSDRCRPWQLTADDAHDLLLSFAKSPAYVRTVLTGMYDVVRRISEINCPVLIVQGLTDSLISSQSPRYLALLPQAQLQILPNLSHVPISDDPALIAKLIVDFAAAERPLAA
jgi:pimeloyl-ACP methyl ester carboxylesterase